VATAGASPSVDPATEARFRQGDRAAFMTVYAACAPAVRGLVGRFFARAFEREEAVQEVWLLVHRMAASFDPGRGPLLPWLRTLAANRCKELLRAQGRRPDPRSEVDEDTIGGDAGAERVLGDARLRAAVERFAAALGPEDAAVFRLSLVEERTHDDVARATGISPRRCKYLRMKLLLRVAADPALRQALAEVTGP
jgi:RNA polymerase sigma factor (sigma-70 family)